MATSPRRNKSIPTRHLLEEDSQINLQSAEQIPSAPPLKLQNSEQLGTPLPEPSFRRPGQDIPISTTFTGGAARSRSIRDVEALVSPTSERPPIPSALSSTGPQGVYSTPLPLLPMVVLSITMLGEFLSANVSTPFLLFMVEGFFSNNANADVGYWTGILVSTFFLSQFLTSLLWATVAERHGQRAVLFVSLLGSAFTCVAFGTSRSLPEALTIRLLQGVFAGSMGVARSNVVNITDGTNEGRAYAILGFSWGLGGVVGAIVGGTFETPVKKWPSVFPENSVFSRLPYLLPCLIAGSITFIGAILSLFLARDGGPRGGAIRLPLGKEATEPIFEETEALIADDRSLTRPKNIIQRLYHILSKFFSHVFTRRVSYVEHPSSPLHNHVLAPQPAPGTRTSGAVYRPSRATGSAYGYGGRTRLSSSLRLQPGSHMRRRRGTFGEPTIDARGHHEHGNFAQRLLMANENAVTNIADLWVAAAMNVDNEEVFISDDDGVWDVEPAEGNDVIDLRSARVEEPNEFNNDVATPHISTVGSSLSRGRQMPAATRNSFRSHFTPSRARLPSSGREFPPISSHLGRPRLPRGFFSTASSQIPSIYSNTGVRAPPGLVEEISMPMHVTGRNQTDDLVLPDLLSGVPETTPPPETFEKPPSVFKQLPFMIILQYGLLALHSTTHDQVFLSYLVSKYDVGGLGLNAANFAQLIALMSLAQIAYQFYLYPNMGPPRGRFSHLAMFRLGSLLFIPAYLSVILYRVFANSDGSGSLVIMSLLAVSTAIRYCGITFGYTAIAILLNYVSPPSVVGIANGLAQSIVSLARFAGPVLGGYVWSISVQDNPGGYPLGFFICFGVCTLAISLSFLIR